MNTLRNRPWLFGLGVAILIVAATVLLAPRGLGSRRHELGSDRQGAAVSGARSVVCFGYVDVEGGVLAVRPSVAGRVVEVPVAENQTVPAGTILLRLDDTLARHQVEEARADLKTAEALLAQARRLPEQHQVRLAMQRDAIEAADSRLSAARSVLARKQNLQQSKLASAEDVQVAADQAKELEAASRLEQQKLRDLELQDIAAQRAAADEAVRARQARLDQAQHRLAECAIRAPVAGQVLRVLAAPGDVAGEPGSGPVIQFCPDQPRIVRAEVPQGFVSLLAVGRPVVIQDDVRTEETWHGKVARISDWYTQRRSVLQEPSQRNDVRTVECIVTFDPGQSPVRIGQRMLVSLNGAPGSP
ncbi:hypothetical protein AYO44_17700 [Planctomycetaceae bacterium SCGC AG-212-F19]|nr:hypothetical protein AYO44_17700 [Planctomycetaceae bacterium SCGC AG-212-F19]